MRRFLQVQQPSRVRLVDLLRCLEDEDDDDDDDGKALLAEAVRSCMISSQCMRKGEKEEEEEEEEEEEREGDGEKKSRNNSTKFRGKKQT